MDGNTENTESMPCSKCDKLIRKCNMRKHQETSVCKKRANEKRKAAQLAETVQQSPDAQQNEEKQN
jgi:hypothetical protein